MSSHFILTIHLYDQRYHGADEWPPAPARVFQALVAGAAAGGSVPRSAALVLKLLEDLPPPVIAAPRARRGQRVAVYVPSNDLDTVGGDPDRIGDVRVKKSVQPYLLEDAPTFLYAWALPEQTNLELVAIADGLYQFGRGIDPAWAVGELIDSEELRDRLCEYRGIIHRPKVGDGFNELATPTRGTLDSILHRFNAALKRLQQRHDGRTNFMQPPKARFAMVRYDGVPTYHLFELRKESDPTKVFPWTAERVTSLVEHVRDTAVHALSTALPNMKADIEQILVGRRVCGAKASPIEQRVRFVPLPSIGHMHADQLIRRVLVQIPPGPLLENDVLWALSGRQLFGAHAGELCDVTLSAAPADEMVALYSASSRSWRSVTPLALSSTSRRKISPSHRLKEATSGTERVSEEQAAMCAVTEALRHAAIDTPLVRVHVQREPFERNGTRAERFAERTRFPKESLWHVELEFCRAVKGPLLLGDGRFLGLGLMAPARDVVPGAHAFAIAAGLVGQPEALGVARALRRAVMARVQATLGARERLAPFFSGHAEDSTPIQRSHSSHLSFAFEPELRRLLILAPHFVERRQPSYHELRHLRTLDAALEGFYELRAGHAGIFSLSRAAIGDLDNSLLGRSRLWKTITPYVVTRHAKSGAATEVLAADVKAECRRLGLPEPRVEASDVRGEPGTGLTGNVRLLFERGVAGPLLLGRTRYFGGGLFYPIDEPDQP